MTKKTIEFYRDAYREFKRIDTGQTCGQLAIRLGVDRTTISAWRRGRTPDSPQGPLDKETLEQAENMLNAGYSYSVVSRYLHVSTDAVRRHFPGKGWKQGPFPKIEYSLDEYVEN